jgi:hemolysin activation/secretion protein
LGYQSSESSDIQNQNSFSISDYSNTFLTSQFEFISFKSDEFLFPEKTKVDFKTGVGSRRSKFSKNDQVFLNLNLKQVFFLNDKNNIQIKSQNYYLSSDIYIINELYRFGGINSIRGFNENSLQANFFSSLLSEYRYVVAPNLYVHSIIDYGYYNDETSANRGNLIGLGFGFGLATKNGLFNVVYANGSTNEQEIKGSNSIVHVSFKTQF